MFPFNKNDGGDESNQNDNRRQNQNQENNKNEQNEQIEQNQSELNNSSTNQYNSPRIPSDSPTLSNSRFGAAGNSPNLNSNNNGARFANLNRNSTRNRSASRSSNSSRGSRSGSDSGNSYTNSISNSNTNIGTNSHGLNTSSVNSSYLPVVGVSHAASARIPRSIFRPSRPPNIRTVSADAVLPQSSNPDNPTNNNTSSFPSHNYNAPNSAGLASSGATTPGVDASRSPRPNRNRVRFPVNNDVNSGGVFYPSDDTLGSHLDGNHSSTSINSNLRDPSLSPLHHRNTSNESASPNGNNLNNANSPHYNDNASPLSNTNDNSFNNSSPNSPVFNSNAFSNNSNNHRGFSQNSSTTSYFPPGVRHPFRYPSGSEPISAASSPGSSSGVQSPSALNFGQHSYPVAPEQVAAALEAERRRINLRERSHSRESYRDSTPTSIHSTPTNGGAGVTNTNSNTNLSGITDSNQNSDSANKSLYSTQNKGAPSFQLFDSHGSKIEESSSPFADSNDKSSSSTSSNRNSRSKDREMSSDRGRSRERLRPQIILERNESDESENEQQTTQNTIKNSSIKSPLHPNANKNNGNSNNSDAYTKNESSATNSEKNSDSTLDSGRNLHQLKSASAPGSVSSSPAVGPYGGSPANTDIPLLDLNLNKNEKDQPPNPSADKAQQEAQNLVNTHMQQLQSRLHANNISSEPFAVPNSNPHQDTDVRDDFVDPDVEYVPPPSHVRGGILSALLKLYGTDALNPNRSSATLVGGSSVPPSAPQTPIPSGATTPTKPPKWYSRSTNASTSSLANLLVGTGNMLGAPGSSHTPHRSFDGSERLLSGSARPSASRKHSSFFPTSSKNKERDREKERERERLKRKKEERIKITIHIAEILQRQKFILKICRAFMLYGAPTHRLEEYMIMAARILEIDGQFLYLPGCMIVTFGDTSTHTSEMQLVKVAQGVNLSKLHNAHLIYKAVVHDLIGVEEAMTQLDQLMKSKNRYPEFISIPSYGIATALVCVLFNGYWLDLPISGFLGFIVGFLQLYVSPRSALYTNVFEISAAIIVSFLGRAFGSIGSGDAKVFCFSAVTQGALALILPGYIILCGALELQSKNLVAGAVRMFYAIIYSMFLSFGITLGAAIFGWIYADAVGSVTCRRSVSPWFLFLFVPAYTVGLCIINQAAPRQLPVMILVSGAGYAVQYLFNYYFSNASQVSSALGCFTIGVLGNLYSRIGHGLAVAAMLPAIFVIVPSGIAAQGSLISGLSNAESLKGSSSSSSSVITLSESSLLTFAPTYSVNTIRNIFTTTTPSLSESTITTSISGSIETVIETITSMVESVITTSSTTSVLVTPSPTVETMTQAITSALSTNSTAQQTFTFIGSSMINIAVGMTIGLFAATLVVYPLGKKRSGLFTF